MEIFEAIKKRRSCREFLPDPIPDALIGKILEAAIWAPSPLNSQPWSFYVITSKKIKDKIFNETVRCKEWAREVSGWKWLGGYDPGFLKQAPVMIAVVGNPKGTGVDMFQEEGNMGYIQACAAAIQNMHLAIHALGLGSVWFTFFDKQPMRKILGVGEDQVPLAIICLGRIAKKPASVPRKGLDKKVIYLR